MKPKPEIRAMPRSPKDGLNHQKERRGKGGFFPKALRGNGPVTLGFGLLASSLVRG